MKSLTLFKKYIRYGTIGILQKLLEIYVDRNIFLKVLDIHKWFKYVKTILTLFAEKLSILQIKRRKIDYL